MKSLRALSSLLLSLFLFLAASQALAHAQSNGFLTLETSETGTRGALQLALTDLAVPIHLDSDSNDEITWGEMKSHSGAINTYVLDHLDINQGEQNCALSVGQHQVENLNSGVYLHIPLQTPCRGETPLGISYRVFSESNASHRGLLNLDFHGTFHRGVFGPDQPFAEFTPESAGFFANVRDFLVQGVTHIWFGYDHLLFLVALILPLFLYRRKGQWVVVDSPQTIQRQIVKTVTAFTVAHSLTLIYATLNETGFPIALVETFIAVSVALSGINVIYPLFRNLHWQFAFAFGLVHGLGFASALQDLNLPTSLFFSSLLSFNLGVEVGQLLIVLLLFPLLYAARRYRQYQRLAMPALAMAIICTGTLWAYDRAAFLWQASGS